MSPVRVYRQDEHQSWGDKIEWLKTPHYSRKRWFRTQVIIGEIVGWLPRKPRVGDLFISPTKEGDDAVFLVTAVRCCADPIDMFYADLMFLKLEPGRLKHRTQRIPESEQISGTNVSK